MKEKIGTIRRMISRMVVKDPRFVEHDSENKNEWVASGGWNKIGYTPHRGFLRPHVLHGTREDGTEGFRMILPVRIETSNWCAGSEKSFIELGYEVTEEGIKVTTEDDRQDVMGIPTEELIKDASAIITDYLQEDN